MKNKKYLTIPIVIILAVSLLSIIPNTPVSSGNKFTEPKIDTNVCIYKNNVLVECKHNLLVDQGRDLIKSISSSGVSSVNVTTMGIGNCSGLTASPPCVQSANDVVLNGTFGASGPVIGTCGLIPAIATFVNQTNGQWNLTYQWTSTCDNTNVNATGVFNQTAATRSGITLFAQANFSNVVLMVNDRINVTWGFVVPTS